METIKEDKPKDKKNKKEESKKAEKTSVQEFEVLQVENKPVVIKDDNNPLSLDGQDLIAYHDLKNKHSFLNLFDGKKSFIEFYQYKVRMLKNVLTSFPLLPLSEMRQEVEQVDLKHQIGSDIASPETIREKIDKCYAWRIRVVAHLSKAYQQYPAWKRISEMLSAKLYLDHDIKGVHKRPSLDLEHMSDILLYVEELKGFIDAASAIDGLLRSAAESLSRQLSCVMIKTQTTGSDHYSHYHLPYQPISEKKPKNEMDDLDSINDGTVIKNVKNTGALISADFGVSKENGFGLTKEDDDLFGNVT